VDIEMPPGPSEILVLADESADPSLIAADLLSQAEHDPMSLPLLITTSFKIAEEVGKEIGIQMESLPRRDIAEKAILGRGAILVAKDLDQAVEITNRIAPEHVEIMVENPLFLIGRIKNAGAIFIGDMSPEPIGDYMAGPSHVLPTGGRARFSSPLSVDEFLKRTSIIGYSRRGLARDMEFGMRIARIEGLEAHARSLERRMGKR
jgi:histidinol dehydrogenase